MKPPWPLLRGRVYAAVTAAVAVEKYYVVVSNNPRNKALPHVLAIPLTTTPKPALPSIVRLGKQEPLTGWAMCDDLCEIWEDEVRRDLGALSPQAMSAVNDGLRAALGL